MRRALEGLEGVESVELRYDDREFDIVHASAVTEAILVEAVKAAGFESTLVSQDSVDGRE